VTSSVVRILNSGSRAAAEARNEVREWFRYLDAGDLASDAELIVSELVTNAVLHGSGQVTIDLRLVPDGVRVAVADEGPGAPARVRAGTRLQHGRGIALVEILADSWGVAELPTGGKEVWCVLRDAPAEQQIGTGTAGRAVV
jgi:anti-sigma regulatory factor (Ser/Thr protein kinase)